MSNTQSANPFSTLALPARFDLDAASIERAYLSGLQTAHPDAGGAVDQSDDSVGDIPDAATLNQARSILLDGEQRAVALLDLLGGPSAASCKELPDGFLMEMMSRREEIEEELAQGEQDARSRWESWAREERSQYASDAQSLFDEHTTDSTPEKRTQIRVLLNAWRYIERLIEQLDPEYDPSQADFR